MFPPRLRGSRAIGKTKIRRIRRRRLLRVFLPIEIKTIIIIIILQVHSRLVALSLVRPVSRAIPFTYRSALISAAESYCVHTTVDLRPRRRRRLPRPFFSAPPLARRAAIPPSLYLPPPAPVRSDHCVSEQSARSPIGPYRLWWLSSCTRVRVG